MRFRVRDVVASVLAAIPLVGAFWVAANSSGDVLLWVLNGIVAVSASLLVLAFLLWRSGRDAAMPDLGEVLMRAGRGALAGFAAAIAVSSLFLATEVMAGRQFGGSGASYYEDVQAFGSTDNLGAAAFMWGPVLGLLTPLPGGPWRVWAFLRALPFGAFAAYVAYNVDVASERAHLDLGLDLAFGAAVVLLLLPLRFWRVRREPRGPSDAAVPAKA